MKAHFIVERPGTVEMTLTITLTVDQWREVLRVLLVGEAPEEMWGASHAVVEEIRKMMEAAERFAPLLGEMRKGTAS